MQTGRLLFSTPHKCFLFFQLTDAVEFLIHSYPKFVTVGSLPCNSTAHRVGCFGSRCISVIDSSSLKMHFPPTDCFGQTAVWKGDYPYFRTSVVQTEFSIFSLHCLKCFRIASSEYIFTRLNCLNHQFCVGCLIQIPRHSFGERACLLAVDTTQKY